VNSADANVGTVVETADVLEIGFQTIGRTEQEILVSDQENTNSEKQQRQNNEDTNSKRRGHVLPLRTVQELHDKWIAALLQIRKRSFDQNLAVTHQG